MGFLLKVFNGGWSDLSCVPSRAYPTPQAVQTRGTTSDWALRNWWLVPRKLLRKAPLRRKCTSWYWSEPDTNRADCGRLHVGNPGGLRQRISLGTIDLNISAQPAGELKMT